MSANPIPIANLARWLLANLDHLRQLDAAPEAVEEIHAIVSQIRRDIDRPAPQWYAGQCDDCGRDLYSRTGPGYGLIECKCGRNYDVATQRSKLLAAAEDRLATVTEACRAITSLSGEHVTRDMVNGYIRRGRLLAHTVTTSGRALYRIGDIRELLDADATRRAEAVA